MELMELQDFFSYQPVFEEKPQFLVDQIKYLAHQYSKETQIDEKIQKAYEFAFASHGEGRRLSGEPYIVHPLKSTLFLMDIKPDIATIQTCILHDVIEDTPITYEDIKKEFGKEVAVLCEGLVKVSKVRYSGEERQLETIKKTFLAMGKDLRVIFVKFADRIHNIQTLHYHPKEEKRQRIALETMKIFVPLARRLGLFHFQFYLENGSFKILHPAAFESIYNYLQTHFGEKQNFTQQGIDIITNLLHKEGIKNFTIKGRLKSPYRIFEKMDNKYKSTDFSNILDVLAFRVITQNIADCYNVLGIIHSSYTPLIKKIKDYIALPKFNGYRSLHTTIMGMFNIPIEIQIRTEEMEAIGEYGVAAHVGYTENKGSTLMTQNQIDWIKRLQDIVKAYKSVDDKEGFKNELDIEVLEKNIFCYTPKGDIIELPKGSTLLDFAFRIHSDVGLKFKNGIVNGLIKPLGYSLQTGDIIDIETYKNKYTASRHRLEYLHTPTAKTKLNKFINQHEIAESLKKAVDLFNRKLTEHKLPKLYSNGDLISSTHNKEKLNALLIKMLEKHHMVEPFLKKIYKDHESFMTPKTTTAKKSGSTTSSNIIIDQNQQFTYQLCPECLPNPLDRIIAKSSKTGIKIHTLTCKALKTIMFDKLYEAHRAGEESTRYKFTLHLEIATHLTNLVNIMKLFDELKIKVVSMNIETTENDSTLLAIQSEFQNPNKIHFLLKELRKNEPSLLIVKKELA